MAKHIPHYILGHINPDTDSIVSTYVLAWLHRVLDSDSQATAIRLGTVNRQTKWLFAQAGCVLPALRESSLYRAREVSRQLPVVELDCPLIEALEIMQRTGTEFVAVLDSDRRPCGIVSDRTQRTNYLLQCNVEDFVGTLLSFGQIVRGLRLEPLGSQPIPEIDHLQVPLHKSNVAGDWDSRTALVIGDRELFIETIHAHPPGAVIITEVDAERAAAIAGQLPCPAYRHRGSVISMFTRLPGCFPASAAMVEEFVSVDEAAGENEVSRQLKKSNWGVMVLDEQGRAVGSITAIDVLNLPRPRISLVDHSERAQSIEGLQDAEVVEIIDHHRLGDVETIQPLHIDVRPLGSTASILYERIVQAGLTPPPEIAKLLLGALIADTLLLTSPTCAASDPARAEVLAQLAEVELQEFGRELLLQNDELKTASAKDLVGRDCKRFNFEEVAFVVAQIETVDLTSLDKSRAAAIGDEALRRVRADGLAFGVVMVTDVLRGKSRILLLSDYVEWPRALLPEATRKAGDPWILEDFVSRKKQLLPLLLNKIKQEIAR